MVKIEKIQLSALISLKRIFFVVLFMGLVSQSWAQIGLPPIILGAPASQRVVPGANVTFDVLLGVSLTPLTYQWQLNGTNIPNATSKSYTRTNVQPGDAGNYKVLVTNRTGTSDATANLTVDATSVRLTSSLLSDGALKLHIEGPLIATYVVQSSTNLKTWTSISTNLVALGLLDLTLAKSPENSDVPRFYRVRVY